MAHSSEENFNLERKRKDKFLQETASNGTKDIDNIEEEQKSKTTCSSVGKSEEPVIINIPRIIFRDIVQIVQKNQINGTYLQTLCYLLGKPKQNKQDVWIDTVI